MLDLLECRSVPDALPFPSVYRRFLPAIRMKCRRILAQLEDAEDVAHESFVRLLQHGPSWSTEADTPVVMAWLYRTCTRLAIDTLRSRARLTLTSDPSRDDQESWWPGGVALESALHARRLVHTLCKRVDGDELEAAVLCRVDGLSQLEAAAVLGVSERTMRRLLERFDVHVKQWREEYAS
jgi:RNA polymerase sigma-70 factor (ECF subfamily)